MNLTKMYKNRFFEDELKIKNNIWKTLCCNFFNKFIKKEYTVLDIGAGYCEFINNIDCKNKIALDVNEDIKQYAQSNVKIINESCFAIESLPSNSVDAVFMSNFLEHMLNKQDVFKVLEESKRVLKIDGKLLILQPNIKYCGAKYWDFFDHHTPLTDKSLMEALELLNLKILKCYPRFLPYSTKSKIPKHPFLVKLYLKFPLIWNIMGEQTFIVAQKEEVKA